MSLGVQSGGNVPFGIEMGSYTGDGKKGSSYPNSITFGRVPKAVFIHGGTSGNGWKIAEITCVGGTWSGSSAGSSSGSSLAVSLSGTTVSWYASKTTASASDQMNESTTYSWIAITE